MAGSDWGQFSSSTAEAARYFNDSLLQVVQAGDLALSGVSAVGEATVSSARASADAMKRAVHESLGHEDDEIHVVLPDEDLEGLAKKYGVSKRDLIRVNSLNRRSLRPGQELIIPGKKI